MVQMILVLIAAIGGLMGLSALAKQELRLSRKFTLRGNTAELVALSLIVGSIGLGAFAMFGFARFVDWYAGP